MPRERTREWYLLALLPLVLQETSCSASPPRRPVCEPGLEFWSVERASCRPCTKCAPEFTLSPCAVHKDAICGPLSALELDWSFLSTRKRPESSRASLETSVTSETLWRFPESGHQQRTRQEVKNSPEDADHHSGDPNGQQIAHLYARKTSTSDEEILWDWQTGALIMAVCACILFFIVAGCSALVYARQWRRMKKNFEPAGFEEISARLNLMVKAELAEMVAGASMNPGDPEIRCQYLEKLLDRKRETPVTIGWPEISGNLYIEEGEPSKRKKLQIARIHRNIETILNQRKSCGDL